MIVSTGIYTKPDFINIDKLNKNNKIKLVHSAEYLYPEDYKNKNVIVIGHANSTVEISSDIAKSAKEVFNVYRKPSFVFPKYLFSHNYDKVLPFNLAIIKRDQVTIDNKVDEKENNKIKNNMYSLLTGQGEISKELSIEKDSVNFPFFAISQTYLDYVKKKSY